MTFPLDGEMKDSFLRAFAVDVRRAAVGWCCGVVFLGGRQGWEISYDEAALYELYHMHLIRASADESLMVCCFHPILPILNWSCAPVGVQANVWQGLGLG